MSFFEHPGILRIFHNCGARDNIFIKIKNQRVTFLYKSCIEGIDVAIEETHKHMGKCNDKPFVVKTKIIYANGKKLCYKTAFGSKEPAQNFFKRLVENIKIVQSRPDDVNLEV